MPMMTAIPHPNVISSQSASVVIPAPRPDWGSAATYIATTPVPNMMSTIVPRNSESSSPHCVFRQAA